MKFAWIICVLTIAFDLVQMQSFERSDEVETDLKYDPKIKVTDRPPEAGQVSAKTKNNMNRSSLRTHASGDSRVKNHPIPKSQRKEPQNGPSFVPTTRRPLMKTRKFTTKPHTVYRVRSNEQRNYSRRRQSNSSKGFRHQNERNSNQIKSSAPENVNDRFKDFKDSDELEQKKNNVPTARVRSLIPAASEKFTVRTLPNKNETIDNIFRSKAKLAIEESLQKFKDVKPVPKGKPTIMDSSSSSENISFKPVIVQDVRENKAKPKSISKYPLQFTTDKIITSTITTEKLDESESVIITKTETPKQTITTTTPKFDYSVTKSEKSIFESTIITTEKTHIPVSKTTEAVTEKSLVDSHIITTEKLNIPVSKTTEAVTEKSLVDSPIITTEKLNIPVSKTTEAVTEKSLVDSPIITTEKLNIPVSEAVEVVTDKSKISVVDSTFITTEKSNYSASETMEVVTDNKLVTIEQKADFNMPIFTKETVISTQKSPPNNVDSLLAIKEIEQLLTRRKRANNVIEEEPVVTTSYGLELNRRQSPINVHFFYNNIHV